MEYEISFRLLMKFTSLSTHYSTKGRALKGRAQVHRTNCLHNKMTQEVWLMKKKEVTARSFVRLPDGTVLPVSTIHNVGSPDQWVERHIPQEEWKQIRKQMMKRTGQVMSDEYSAHRFT